jgi:hypothetical protein
MKLVVHLADFGWPVEADELPGLLGDVGELTEAGGVVPVVAELPTRSEQSGIHMSFITGTPGAPPLPDAAE